MLKLKEELYLYVHVCAHACTHTHRKYIFHYTDYGAVRPSFLSYLPLSKQIPEIPNHSDFISAY